MRPPDTTRSRVQSNDAIIAAVLDLLYLHGYDGLRLRDVVERAHVSLATLYRLYPSRESLIAAAVLRWADDHMYPRFTTGPVPDKLFDLLNWLVLAIIEPLENAPWMARVYHRAYQGESGELLQTRYFQEVRKVVTPIFASLDQQYIDDLDFMLSRVFTTLMDEVASGQCSPRKALAQMQQAILRLTHDNRSLAAGNPSSRDPVVKLAGHAGGKASLQRS